MKFRFRDIPDPGSNAVRSRPIVDVVVDGLDLAPQACLLDSGASAVRMGAHVADMIGLDLSRAQTSRVAIGGALVTGRMGFVGLEVSDAVDAHRWEAPVWFCEPWRPAFGLLGLTGFFDRFVVTIDAYEESIELRAV